VFLLRRGSGRAAFSISTLFEIRCGGTAVEAHRISAQHGTVYAFMRKRRDPRLDQ